MYIYIYIYDLDQKSRGHLNRFPQVKMEGSRTFYKGKAC